MFDEWVVGFLFELLSAVHYLKQNFRRNVLWTDTVPFFRQNVRDDIFRFF